MSGDAKQALLSSVLTRIRPYLSRLFPIEESLTGSDVAIAYGRVLGLGLRDGIPLGIPRLMPSTVHSLFPRLRSSGRVVSEPTRLVSLGFAEALGPGGDLVFTDAEWLAQLQ